MDAYLVRIPGDTGRPPSEQAVADLLGKAGARGRLDLGDAWAGLHVVLTSEPIIPRHEALGRGISWDDDSLENVLMGGEPTPYGTSFGPARYLAPDRVKVLADGLEGVSPGEFAGMYDPEYLEELEVPPGSWADPERAEGLLAAYTDLREFFRAAAAAGDAILIGFQ